MSTIKKKTVKPFTGIARSVVCYDHNSQFRNFKIITLHIENDVVVKKTFSDPYVNFEAISRLEIENELGILNLNNSWEDGKAMQK